MKMSRELLASIGSNADEELFQASMGIYVFNRDVLIQCFAERSGRFRETYHPAIDQGPACQRLHFQGLLGRHRNDPRLLRSESRSHGSSARSTVSSSPMLRSTRIRAFCREARSTAPPCGRRSFRMDASSRTRTWNDVSSGMRSIIQSGATIRNSIVMGADYFELGRN